MQVLWVLVVVLAVWAIHGRYHRRQNVGVVEHADMSGLSSTGITGIAEVLGAAQRAISQQRNCRVDFTSVKQVLPQQSGNGTTVYVVDAMLMNACTTAQTFERLHVVLLNNGNVTVHSTTPVTPVPSVNVSAAPSLLDSAINVISSNGQIKQGGEITEGYSIAPVLSPAQSGEPPAYPLEHVQDNVMHAKAPAEIPNNLDFGILKQMSTQPLQDLTNSLAYEKSALAIQYT